MLPRPDLEALGITYRRIPLLAIGKDIYADSNLVIDVALSLGKGKLATSPADQAYKEWADVVFNNDILGLIPMEVLTPEFLKDREGIFPLLQRPDVATLRPSALGQFKSRMRQIENGFLAGSGPFVNGAQVSAADIHMIWPVKWVLETLGLGKEPGFGQADFPKTYKLIESLPSYSPKVLSAEETHKTIREGEYTAQGPTEVAKDDPLGIAKGTKVNVESFE